MKPEEYLDLSIERRERGETPLPVINDEIAASLAAAETLARLREIDVPREFASRLELSIRARARGLAQQNGRTIPLAHPRSPASSHRFLRRRALILVLGTAAVLMLVYIGMLMAYTPSLPGDPLYGLKQAENQFTRTFTSDPEARASVQIDQLRSSLVDLSTVVNDGRSDDAIRLALNIVAVNTSESRRAVAVVPAGTGREAAQQDLDSALAVEEQTLRHLLDHVDWPMQLAFTKQLGALGDPVPTVMHVMILTQDNGTLLIILTGTHFAPHAELIIDGRPTGMVSQITSEQLVAVISSSTWSPGTHALGVRNPDGTAAQIIFNGGPGSHQQPTQQLPSAPHPTPTAHPTQQPAPSPTPPPTLQPTPSPTPHPTPSPSRENDTSGSRDRSGE